MKKVLAVLAVVLVLGGIALAGLQPWGFSLAGIEFAWSPEYREVQALGRDFMEDVQFKDWDQASSYHTWAEKQEADIPEQIRRLFGIKPEQLHIENVRLMGVTVSKDGLRARTRFKAHVEVLNTAKDKEEENKNRDMELNLYWQRRPVSEAFPPAGTETPAEGTPAAPAEATPAAGAEGTPAAGAEGTPAADPDATAADTDAAAEPAKDTKAADSTEETRWFLYLRDSLDEAQLPGLPR